MTATPLDEAKYISVRSFKRDGSAVDTPVWVAPMDGKLLFFTLRETYKVKRIQRNPRVQVADCDVRGKLLGPWLDGQCVVVEDPERQARAYATFRRKYGLIMYAGDFMSKLSGRMKRRVLFEVTLD